MYYKTVQGKRVHHGWCSQIAGNANLVGITYREPNCVYCRDTEQPEVYVAPTPKHAVKGARKLKASSAVEQLLMRFKAEGALSIEYLYEESSRMVALKHASRKIHQGNFFTKVEIAELLDIPLDVVEEAVNYEGDYVGSYSESMNFTYRVAMIKADKLRKKLKKTSYS